MPDQTATNDNSQDRLAKLLPGDVTAAFLSAKAALIASAHEAAAPYVVYTFLGILVLCPFYFRFVLGVKSWPHIVFLTLSFVVFGLSIASTEFVAFFKDWPVQGSNPEPAINAAAIVLPILWTYLVTQISVATLKYDGSVLPPSIKP
jgi:hypothetical protein